MSFRELSGGARRGDRCLGLPTLRRKDIELAKCGVDLSARLI
ncbi:MAG: hypothetical protein ACXWLB_13105 [Reyranella sp.]